MLMSLGDFLDRWSIAKLKATRIKSQECIEEFNDFNAELEQIKITFPQYNILQWSELFVTINNNIWQLESGLKSGLEELPNMQYILDAKNQKTLSKLGTVSVLIRNHNAERTQFKNIVNTLVGEGFQDIKSNHISEKGKNND